MSRSDWVKHPKTRLAGGLITAVVFCAVWLGYGLSQSAKYERQARANTAEYARYSRDKVAKTCVPLPRVEAIKCLYDARDAQREYRYNQSDLVAQRQSALWAYIMAAAAILGMLLSAVGVWLVYGTWKQTAAGAESARITLRSYIAKERAVIVCKGLRYAWQQEPGCNDTGLVALVANYGASPGTITGVEWEYVSEPLWPEKFRFKTLDKRTLVAEAEGRTPLMFWEDEPKTGTRVWLVGVVHYTTLENQRFETPFCYEFSFSEDDGYQGPELNCAEFPCAGMPTHT